MKEQKINAIERLLPEKRYGFALEAIIKEQELWVLEKEENALAVSNFEEKTIVAIWPHEEFAKNAISKNWIDFHVKKIELGKLEPWLEFFEDNKWILDVFPVGGKTGVLVTIEEFINDLNKIAQSNADD